VDQQGAARPGFPNQQQQPAQNKQGCYVNNIGHANIVTYYKQTPVPNDIGYVNNIMNHRQQHVQNNLRYRDNTMRRYENKIGNNQQQSAHSNDGYCFNTVSNNTALTNVQITARKTKLNIEKKTRNGMNGLEVEIDGYWCKSAKLLNLDDLLTYQSPSNLPQQVCKSHQKPALRCQIQ
jgi:hypothetical protein